MTDKPLPVSPDFATMAKEITGPCTCAEVYTIRKMEDPGCAWHGYAPEIETALTLSHAAGRAVGLEEAAKWHDNEAARLRHLADGLKRQDGRTVSTLRDDAEQHEKSARSIRALASVAGDQVAEDDDSWRFEAARKTGEFMKEQRAANAASARAPALAAQEVERLRETVIGSLMLMQLAHRSGDHADVLAHINLLLSDLSAPRPAPKGPTE